MGDRSVLSAARCRAAPPLPEAGGEGGAENFASSSQPGFDDMVACEQAFLDDGPPSPPELTEEIEVAMVTRRRRAQLLHDHAARRRTILRGNAASISSARRAVATSSAMASASGGLSRVMIPTWVQQFSPSHRIRFVGDIFFCSLCGSFSATSRQGLLTEACRTAELTLHEQAQWRRSRPQLGRLLRGLLPASLAAWPDEGAVSEHRLVVALHWSSQYGWMAGAGA